MDTKEIELTGTEWYWRLYNHIETVWENTLPDYQRPPASPCTVLRAFLVKGPALLVKHPLRFFALNGDVIALLCACAVILGGLLLISFLAGSGITESNGWEIQSSALQALIGLGVFLGAGTCAGIVIESAFAFDAFVKNRFRVKGWRTMYPLDKGIASLALVIGFLPRTIWVTLACIMLMIGRGLGAGIAWFARLIGLPTAWRVAAPKAAGFFGFLWQGIRDWHNGICRPITIKKVV